MPGRPATAASCGLLPCPCSSTPIGRRPWRCRGKAHGRRTGPPNASRRAGSSAAPCVVRRSEEHTSELQSHSDLVCRLLLEKKKIDELTARAPDCLLVVRGV